MRDIKREVWNERMRRFKNNLTDIESREGVIKLKIKALEDDLDFLTQEKVKARYEVEFETDIGRHYGFIK